MLPVPARRFDIYRAAASSGEACASVYRKSADADELRGCCPPDGATPSLLLRLSIPLRVSLRLPSTRLRLPSTWLRLPPSLLASGPTRVAMSGDKDGRPLRVDAV